MDSISTFQPFELRSFTNDHCFLCGKTVVDSKATNGKQVNNTRTDEHIFPERILKKFGLWDKKFILPNNTPIPYRLLRIICCYKCNHDYLEPIEKAVLDAADNGFEEFAKLDARLVYLWAAKVFFGLLCKEFNLPVDRKKPESGMILPKEILETFKDLHDFLQWARLPMRFRNFKPGSLLGVEINTTTGTKNFGCQIFNNALGTAVLSIRMHDVGLIACLSDYGKQSPYLDAIDRRIGSSKLTPIQFEQLFIDICYSTAKLIEAQPRQTTGFHRTDDYIEVYIAVDTPYLP